MATTDIRGATVDATDAPSSSTPNAGLAIKTAVRAATTGANIDLQNFGLGVLDGVQLNAGDRVLVKDQTDPTTNGIYNASSGVWALSSDFQNNSQLAQGLLVFVPLGGANAFTLWVLSTANPVLLGTSAILFAGASVSGRRQQRCIRTAGDLPIRSTDQDLIFDAATDLTPQIPAAATRNGVSLRTKNMAGAHQQTLLRTGTDTFDGAVIWPLPAAAEDEFNPFNDGVNNALGYWVS